VQKENLKKKTKVQDFMDITNLFLGKLSFSPWIVFATWMNLGAFQKKKKNKNKEIQQP
jgi:hypothetical protein